MSLSTDQLRLLTLCAARIPGVKKAHSLDWSLLAREAVRPGGLDDLYAGRISESPSSHKIAKDARYLLPKALKLLGEAEARVHEELALAQDAGARLITVLDEDYPINLRLIWNLPPFLFVKGGKFKSNDIYSTAVVGTRDASTEGLKRARKITEELVDMGVTIVSGLAAGVDTAAHCATLASKGRTIAVVGTGVCHTFPKENTELAELIVDTGGVVVSQFWPSTRPARWTFPRRNVVTSGISQGTIVVEASKTSGAKMQARLALEHGKKVFLLKSLVSRQPWAQSYIEKRGAIEVSQTSQIINNLASPDRVQSQVSQRQLVLELG